MEERNITVKLEGDDAILANLLVTLLRVKGDKKTEKDKALVELSLKSLNYVVNEVKIKTGKPYPSSLDIENFLKEKGENCSLL